MTRFLKYLLLSCIALFSLNDTLSAQSKNPLLFKSYYYISCSEKGSDEAPDTLLLYDKSYKDSILNSIEKECTYQAYHFANAGRLYLEVGDRSGKLSVDETTYEILSGYQMTILPGLYNNYLYYLDKNRLMLIRKY